MKILATIKLSMKLRVIVCKIIVNGMVQEANGLVNETDKKQGINNKEQELRTIIRVEAEELENIFNQILENMEHYILLEMHSR